MRTRALLTATSTLWLLACQPPSEPATALTREVSTQDRLDLEGASTCANLAPGEALLAVSPQGHAWLSAPGEGASRLRVLSPESLGTMHEREVALTGLTSLRAWSATDASLSAQGALWRLEDFARVQREAPRDGMSAVSLCGSLEDDGFVLSEGWLHELREDAWIGGELPAEQAPSRLLGRLGECTGPDQTLWATSEDGALFQIQDNVYREHARFDALRDAAATADGVAVLDGPLLWLVNTGAAESWTYWSLEGEGASALTSSATAVWVQSAEALWRWERGQWSRLKLPEAQDPVALHAHDNGVWWATQTQICHHAVGAGVQVEGLRPFGKTRATSLTLRLGSKAPVVVTVGDQEVETTQASQGVWSVNVPLDTVGWHVVRMTTSLGERDYPVERLAPVERSWAQDVQPVFEVHCSECHRPGSLSVDLSTHALWVEEADQIRAFVVDAQTMPPEVSRKDAWGEETRAVITQWLDGEQRP